MNESDLICPFCNENDFDTIGLKHHLLSGGCETFNATITIAEERHLSNHGLIHVCDKCGLEHYSHMSAAKCCR